ncbi:flavin reductase family protein [Rufibacter glacialis]|uniref:2Fe-2S iron-sulfur cluster binding domain-containing protein n=1 Tax=Rufibacter glacialis TaxID=1259555 RepID=A0A5M8Q6X3_9BACT|nr:iron-sulfur cluster-binding domain-containing protein [Rufibacter glacialis]KAA6431647.1 2Fe-2S iron-sulfur cluster binding domain-containing protein [Rufibacter glacialis]GGK82713.1 flavodoxin reductase [Rufibacter glacialis]
MSVPYLPLTISQIKEEVPGVKTFVFGGGEAHSISYLPGQYLTLVAPTAQGEVRRSYSITSSPILGEPLTIGVKRIPNGIFSRRLVDEAREGEQVLTAGAAGLFVLPQEMDHVQQVFFWAAGSGITPIFSLLKTVLYAHPSVAVVLVYSNHDQHSTLFYRELLQLESDFPDRLKILFLFSNSPRLDQARLHQDLLKRIVKENAIAPLGKIVCYVCGPENYRRLCRYGLRAAGIPADNLRQETFSTTKVPARIAPPDTLPHLVSLLYQGVTRQIVPQYPDNILLAARKAGIFLPYSCEAGRCGNCVARCLEGEVWMSYNEVLTQKDLDQGLVLTCVGHPVGGEVVLEIK